VKCRNSRIFFERNGDLLEVGQLLAWVRVRAGVLGQQGSVVVTILKKGQKNYAWKLAAKNGSTKY
jgi:hypothetical protein